MNLLDATIFLMVTIFADPVLADSSSYKPISTEFCGRKGKISEVKASQWKGKTTTLSSSDWITTTYQNPLGFDGEYRWFKDKSGKVFLERHDLGKDFYAPPIEFSSCSSLSEGTITVLKCAASYLLYNKKQLIALSVDEYSEPKTKIIETLNFNNNPALLLEIGIKGGTAWYVVPDKNDAFPVVKCKEEAPNLEND